MYRNVSHGSNPKKVYVIYYARNYYVSMTSKNALKCPTDGSNPKKMYVIYYEIITGMTQSTEEIY